MNWQELGAVGLVLTVGFVFIWRSAGKEAGKHSGCGGNCGCSHRHPGEAEPKKTAPGSARPST